MIQAFEQINRSNGTASVAELSQGIYVALITTAAGLAVAIPCYLAHNFPSSRRSTASSPTWNAPASKPSTP